MQDPLLLHNFSAGAGGPDGGQALISLARRRPSPALEERPEREVQQQQAAAEGQQQGWRQQEQAAAAGSTESGGGTGSLDQYHVVMTAASGIYLQWQSRCAPMLTLPPAAAAAWSGGQPPASVPHAPLAPRP